jgi:hypothetical protein
MGLLTRRQRRGDAVLAALSDPNDSEAAARLQYLRSEGVTDGDIRTWWNLSDKVQRKCREADQLSRMMLYLHRKDQGDNEREAAGYALLHFPVYGEYEDTREGVLLGEEDRPLPPELADRVSRWSMRVGPGAANGAYSSMNARIRAEVRAGRL